MRPLLVGLTAIALCVITLRAAEEVMSDDAAAGEVLKAVEREARRWNVPVSAAGTSDLLRFVVVYQPVSNERAAFCLSGVIGKRDAAGKHTGGAVTIRSRDSGHEPLEEPLSPEQAATIHRWLTSAGLLDPKARPVVSTGMSDADWLYVAISQENQRLGFVRTRGANATTDRFIDEVSRFAILRALGGLM